MTPDQERAEQLAQDVFLRIHRDLPYLRGEATLGTWILRTTAGVCPAAFPGGLPNGGGAAEAVSSRSAEFVVRALDRIRRDRWRRERMLDMAFNMVIATVGIATVGLAWYFLDASGLSALGQGTMTFMGSQLSGAARNVAPSVQGTLPPLR